MSDLAQKRVGHAAPRAPGYLADVGAAVRRTASTAWMITFTDLVALMLTFFVLLFSMSTVERYKWQNLVRSLAGDMDSIQTLDGAKPAVEFQIDQIRPVPGADLDYLAPLVGQLLASEPALAGGNVRRETGRAVLSLPAGILFDDAEPTLAKRADAAVYAIGRMIQTLDNLVEVHVHAAPGVDPSADPSIDPGIDPNIDPRAQGWALSLARASALATALAEFGHPGGIVARGYGGTGPAAPGSLNPSAGTDSAARIEIAIGEDEPEGRI